MPRTRTQQMRVRGGRSVRKTYDFERLPLYVCPGAVIARGARVTFQITGTAESPEVSTPHAPGNLPTVRVIR